MEEVAQGAMETCAAREEGAQGVSKTIGTAETAALP